MMGKSMAEIVEARGQKKGALKNSQATLLRLLRIRFDELPADVVKTIEQTKDLKQLNAWLDRFATATTLADVGIGQTKD